MGVFDEFLFQCPHCLTRHTIQSKANPNPSLSRYTERNVTASIAGELEHIKVECKGCGDTIQFHVSVTVVPFIDDLEVENDDAEEA